MNILVTGGAGFIGSHTTVELLEQGHNVTLVDNFSNSDRVVIKNLEKLTKQSIHCDDLDIRNTEELVAIMERNCIEAVMHFAAFKAVGESVDKPLEYYDNNIGGLLSVLRAMKQTNVRRIVFSSSCTVYGDPESVPLDENATLKPATNPYGATKQMGERILEDIASKGFIQVVLLRYFNPVGAHPSALIGELPIGRPNNLVPYITQTAAGILDELTVFGDDYETSDGSGVRDYIHVVDLAKAHVKSIDYLNSTQEPVTILNIGTGKGTSVLELIHAFEKVNNIKVPYTIGPRRSGDIAEVYASPVKAEGLLSWKAELSIEEALRDAWRWQQSIIN